MDAEPWMPSHGCRAMDAERGAMVASSLIVLSRLSHSSCIVMMQVE
jgi:hypothetical protein